AVLGDGNTDAGGDDDLVSIQVVDAADGIERAGGKRFRLIERGDRSLQDHEFVAAKSRDDVGVANAVLQPLGDGLQKHIAPGMPQRVVNLFELIEVDEVNGAHIV